MCIRDRPNGSIIYDLAASNGGNSEFTKANEVIEIHGVKIMGETNILNNFITFYLIIFSFNKPFII